MQFGLKMSFFKPFEDFNLKMEKVKYSVYQKLITTMMSIVIGCRSTKDINERLSVEKLSANMVGMDTIPDQSQINLLLTRFDSSSILQLQDIHHKLFMDNSNLILRTDSGFGSAKNVKKLLSITNLKFVTKGYSSVKAKSLAKNILYSEYDKADEAAWVYGLPQVNKARYIIVQTLSKRGNLKYSLLITNIIDKEMNAVEVFHFYNKRQTIEAFFKMAKNVYHIKNLRTSKFYGIYGFLWLVFITHNLISSFKATILRGTKLENVGVRVLVRSIGSIKAFVERTSRGINVNIPSITRLSRLIADAICGHRYIQLSFNI
ncbi:transposase [Clostridium tyrobutyricum]|uniref:transposase n=1 Tax=Clostridium tyrobutyricum TaxID=1519 RepID=UPI001C38E549|nr:transposase [Clostridium tyrobutyricum]MBV4424122.1 transposase [Clostridium tyrobutyricum]